MWPNERPLQFPLAFLQLDRLLTQTGEVDLVGETSAAGCRGEIRRWWHTLEMVSRLSMTDDLGLVSDTVARSRVSSASPDDWPALNSTVPFRVDSVQPQGMHSLQVNTKASAAPSIFTHPRPQNSFATCPFPADLAPELAQCDATELALTPDTSVALEESVGTNAPARSKPAERWSTFRVPTSSG